MPALGIDVRTFRKSSICARKAASKLVLDRDGSAIVLEPYAPNIIRVTLSRLKDKATAAPGFGFNATASSTGWKHEVDVRGDGSDLFRLAGYRYRPPLARSTMAPIAIDLPHRQIFPLPYGSLREHYFTVSAPDGNEPARDDRLVSNYNLGPNAAQYAQLGHDS